MKYEDKILSAVKTAFIDKKANSIPAYQPRFIVNDYKNGKKVLTEIEDELRKCDEFMFSVAFMTEAGLKPLLQILAELKQKGIKGKILTTNYKNFTSPVALKTLSELDNIEVRIYYVNEEKNGFHTKGYIFRNDNLYRIIIGSSNLTAWALSLNKEWNIRIASTENGELVGSVLSDFSRMWDRAEPLELCFEAYKKEYEAQKKVEKNKSVKSSQLYSLKPNAMQSRFINNLFEIINAGEKRALLISATGTGKTYASVFAMQKLRPKKLLFVVHRDLIAEQAYESYKYVFGSEVKMGLLSGKRKEYEADFLFSTMQTLAKEETLTQFEKDEFDVIIIDEVHRAGANSYQKIMDYFEPNLWLGMTASPERMDGFDIYALFDHNIAYEIRLKEALEEDLLCPFHYFGITDLEIDGEYFDDTIGLRNFKYLVSDERVDYILEKARYYGYSGERVKGLIFCSRQKEAEELSNKFNQRGLRTIALIGNTSLEKRMEVIEQLTSDDIAEPLDYIFAVDVFNEGVDIPEVNQVIMLRPTESPIVFVQQLGRGLRKSNNKEFVVILDFIGNYTNNFMIPIALFGDRSYNKDTVRKYVREGNRMMPGVSSIHFDEITRRRIYESIDAANFSDIRLIKDSYQQLKYKLGRIPKLMDFEKYGSIDVMRIFDNKSLGSYYKFLVKYEKNYKIRLNKEKEQIIEFISKKLASGKRVHELVVIQRLLDYKHDVFSSLRDKLENDYNMKYSEKTQRNVANVLSNNFATGSAKNTYEACVFIEPEGEDFKISEIFNEMLKDVNFYNMVQELVEFGLYRNKKNYGNPYEDTSFQLYEKYTYEEVCRLLEWEKNEVAQNMGGYKYDANTKTYPVFINYDKGEDIADTIRYEDRFVSPNTLIAISKSGRNINSKDVDMALHAHERGVDMQLFVRKNKDDKISREFYYMGRITATGEAREFVMPNTEKTAVEIYYTLETPVREDLYDYITS